MALYSTVSDSNSQWRDGEQEEFERSIERHESKVAKESNQPGSSNGLHISQRPPIQHGYVSSDEETDHQASVSEIASHLEKVSIERTNEVGARGDQWLSQNSFQEAPLRIAHSMDNLARDVDSEMDDDTASQQLDSMGDGPSGLTTIGPIKNVGDPRDFTRKVTYGQMQTVHEYNVTDGIDECCDKIVPELKDALGPTKRDHSGTLEMAKRATKHLRTKSMTLPHNMAKWANTKCTKDNFKTSAANVFRKGRTFLKNTSSLLKPLIRGQLHDASQKPKEKEQV